MTDQAERLRYLMQQARRGGTSQVATVAPSPSARHARVIAVTSGKGGVGKTNLTANLGVCLAGMGWRTAVLDGDLGLANLNIVLGVDARYDISHVIAGQKRLADIVVPGPRGVQLLAGGAGLYDVANLSAYQLERFVTALSEADQLCDMMLIDTGAGLSEGVIRLVLSAAEVLLVTIPEPTALTDAYGMVKAIARRSPGARVHVVINMVRNDGEGRTVFQHFQNAVSRFLDFELMFLGEVPYDATVNRAVQEQAPFTVAYPKSRVAHAVESLARGLTGMNVPTAGGIKGLLQRMLRSRR